MLDLLYHMNICVLKCLLKHHVSCVTFIHTLVCILYTSIFSKSSKVFYIFGFVPLELENPFATFFWQPGSILWLYGKYGLFVIGSILGDLLLIRISVIQSVLITIPFWFYVPCGNNSGRAHTYSHIFSPDNDVCIDNECNKTKKKVGMNLL